MPAISESGFTRWLYHTRMLHTLPVVEAACAALAGRGVSAEQLGRVAAPIGLPIDAVTAPEIAVSIVAQLVACRRRGKQKASAVRGPLRVAGEAGG